MSEQHMIKLGSGKHSEVWAVNRIRELEQALQDIRKHQEVVVGKGTARHSTTWNIANRALNGMIDE